MWGPSTQRGAPDGLSALALSKFGVHVLMKTMICTLCSYYHDGTLHSNMNTSILSYCNGVNDFFFFLLCIEMHHIFLKRSYGGLDSSKAQNWERLASSMLKYSVMITLDLSIYIYLFQSQKASTIFQFSCHDWF